MSSMRIKKELECTSLQSKRSLNIEFEEKIRRRECQRRVDNLEYMHKIYIS